MRISDLLSRSKSDRKDAIRTEPSPFAPLHSPSFPSPTISEAVRPAVFQPRVRPAETYSRLIEVCRDLFDRLASDPVRMPELDDLCEAVAWTLEGVESEPARLLELAERSTPQDHLIGHTANVAILSAAVGRQLRWPEEHLRALGVGALLHDAGLARHREIYGKEGPADERERAVLRQVPEEGARLLEPFLAELSADSQGTVLRILLEARERISGAGPRGLKGDQIGQEAQVVGLCDYYESLCHPRPHRPRMLSHDALRHLIEKSGEDFHGDLIKRLAEALTPYPPGSFVRLSTGEVGRVIDINRDAPNRPVVRIVVSKGRQKEGGDRTVDLSQFPEISVEKAVDECSLKLSDRRLLLELRAQRWWFC